MELDIFLNIISEYGYFGLFLWLWLGVFGIPIPNEAIVLTVGFVTSQKLLTPWITFVITYLGLLASATTIYLLGRVLGNPILKWVEKNEKRKRYVERAFHLIEKYHSFSLCIAYIIPGMRNFVPFCFGLSKFSYKRFALFTYTTAFVWLTVFFTLGHEFGEHQKKILLYTEEILIVSGILFIGFLIIKYNKAKAKKSRETSSH